MPEYEHNLPTSDDPEWVGLVLDVENRFESLNDALADLRSAVIRLSSYRPQAPEVDESIDESAKAAEAAEAADAAAALAEAVRAFEAAAVVSETPEVEPEPVDSAPESNGSALSEETVAPADDDAARREEVSRMVAEARQQMSPKPVSAMDGSWASPHDDSEVDSTSEGSWPIAHRSGTPVNPPAPLRVVAEESASARSESASDAGAEVGAEDDAEAEPAVEADVHSRRDDVTRMVAEMRSRLGAGEETAAESISEEDEGSGRADAADVVERMRAEVGSGGPAEDKTPSASGEGDASDADADVRDEVRRAVDAARAEMAAGWVKEDGGPADADAGEKKKFSFPDWQNTRMEPSGPPVIVIKDPEGQVELARVYETLSQVNCDENAALLNYTPHSVTVGLNNRAQVPSKEAMEKAIEAVFGRKCRVESDGVRVSVDIGMEKADAA